MIAEYAYVLAHRRVDEYRSHHIWRRPLIIDRRALIGCRVRSARRAAISDIVKSASDARTFTQPMISKAMRPDHDFLRRDAIGHFNLDV